MRYFTISLGGGKIRVKEGEGLLEALVSAGIWIGGDCGGRGACGRCRVRFLGAFPPPTEAERHLLSRGELDDGWRLACQHNVEGDIDIYVPIFGEITREKVEIIPAYVGPLKPAAALEVLEAFPPSWKDRQSELEGLEATLGNALEPSLPLLRALPAALRTDDRWITLIRVGEKVVSVRPGREKLALRGLAVDVGTSTLAAYLLDLETGEVLGGGAIANPQLPFGADVISRIARVRKERSALKRLQEATVSGVNRLVEELASKAEIDPKEVVHSTIVGNPTMLHLLLGVDPSRIGESPFVPVWRTTLVVSAKELGFTVHPEAVVHILPLVSGYIGADTVACILACGLHREEKPCLLLDLGTNGEIVLGNRERILACSAAAGPAFEGGRISCGMPALEGAISRVEIDGGIRCRVNGGGTPRGICGSGLVDLVAGLIREGFLDRTGRLRRPGTHPLAPRIIGSGKDMGFLVEEGIVLTQRDVRELQLAKAAIRAGVEILLLHFGIEPKEIEKVYLAGAFGTQMHPESLVMIGLLPEELLPKIRAVGNAAGTGARSALLNRMALEEAEHIARKVECIELSCEKSFTEKFVEHMRWGDEGGRE